MKFCFRFICLISLCCLSKVELTAQAVGDTNVLKLDYQGRRIIDADDAYSYVLKVWQEPPLWATDLYSYPDQKRLYTRHYADSTRRILQGLYTSYHPSGNISEQGMYENGKRHGRFEGWHENGKRSSLFQYNMGVMIDTNRRWNDAGELVYESVLNAEGTGYVKGMNRGAGFNESGPMLKGARHGEWTIYQEDRLMMKMQYIKDSIAISECYDSLGNVANGPCIYEREAMFPGGANGWYRYLQSNLRYPDEARRGEIQGVVKINFTVDKDGVLSEYSIASSPHESLSREVIRLLQKGPQWMPAIQYNRPVRMRHSQNVVFRLQ